MSENAVSINDILDFFEDGARIKDKSGDLPTHILIEKNFSAGIICRFVGMYPGRLVV